MSSKQALAFAVTWILLIAAIPVIVLIIDHVAALWKVWHSGDGETFFIRVHIRQWAPVVALAVLLSILFLSAWYSARRRRGGRR